MLLSVNPSVCAGAAGQIVGEADGEHTRGRVFGLRPRCPVAGYTVWTASG